MSQEFISLVDKATTSGPMEDWDTILAICEIIIHRPDESSTAVIEAIDQKLRSSNVQVQLLALTLLDACIKNTNDYFVRIVAQSNNINLVQRLTKASNAELRERANELLKEWQPMFQRAQASSPSSPVQSQFISAPQKKQSPQPKKSKAEKRKKLEQDLKVVHDTVQHLIEFVNAADSIQSLKQNSTQQVIYNCEEMHKRLVALIERVPEEDLLLKLIEANEELCAAIDFYDEFKKTGKKDRSLLKPILEHETQQQHLKPQQSKPIDLDDIFTIPEPSPQHQKQYAPGNEPLSLDDLLNMPSRLNGNYDDSMAREFQNVQQQEPTSSSGFDVLARRHTPPVQNNDFNNSPHQASESQAPKQLSPNPFDIDVPTQQFMYPSEPQVSVDHYIPQSHAYKQQEPQELSGFATIAKRKDPSQDFEQFLNYVSTSNPMPQQDK